MTMKPAAITPEVLRHRLRYEPESGIFMDNDNYPPLPPCVHVMPDDIDWEEVQCFSAAQMRAYVDADRAARAQDLQALSHDEVAHILTQSDLWDMSQHIGWYSAPQATFKKHGAQLVRDIEKALTEKNNLKLATAKKDQK